jgi:hypothetical protein
LLLCFTTYRHFSCDINGKLINAAALTFEWWKSSKALLRPKSTGAASDMTIVVLDKEIARELEGSSSCPCIFYQH